MKIEIYADGLEKSDTLNNTVREGSRAIIKIDGKYLILRYETLDIYMFPGGGKEDGETDLDCLKREILEETGYTITKAEHTVTLYEYFLGETWINHYYACEVDLSFKAPLQLTEVEKQYNTYEELYTDIELLDLLDNYDSTNIYGEEIKSREFIAFMNSMERL